MNNPKRLLYYAPTSYGGLLNYAQEQADALGGLGVDVTVLCPPQFAKRPTDRYSVLPELVETRRKPGGNMIFRTIRFVHLLLTNARILRREIRRGGYDKVFFVSYAEYFAPLWAAPFRKLAREGIKFGAMVQEPERNFRIGPEFWHRWSVWNAYSFLSYVFEHDDVPLDTVRPIPGLTTHIVPMGPHQFPDAAESREETRKRLAIPQDAVVLLAFGHIRDNKNLDYAVRALKEVPQAHLLVAGKRTASSQKPESYYMDFARSMGIDGRCTWIIDYVSEEEAANFFSASDIILLTYDSTFRSASGVLNVAARYRRPVIASSGAGSLQNVVKEYRLGVWVDPDDAGAMAEGLKKWMAYPTDPLWNAYDRDNSWAKNAEVVVSATGLTEN
jgi:glycosyltransferase involved in cell wall biosynthesis